jgi:GTPase SAR1 family protein
MGFGLTTEKAAEFNLSKRLELRSIDNKLSKVETKRILLIGPAFAGKTQLVNRLCGIGYSDNYTETETA